MDKVEKLPLVSVCLITYNHVRYIRQAIEGVLMQKVNFSWEFIIADDFSNDGTRDILLEYKEQNREIINLILQEKNKGPAGNWFDLISAPKGKYIAYFEGDDYWTNPFKLQKQVDFLENNSDFSICFHNAKIIYEEEPNRVSFSNPIDQAEISKFEDLAKGEFIYTATCLFRRNDLIKFPQKYYSYLNNYTLDLHNAQFGDIKYINEVMTVYRKHKGGIWSMVAREKILVEHLPVYKFYENYFDKKYKVYFRNHLREMTSELVNIKLKNHDMKNFWACYFDFVFYNFQGIKDLRHMISIFLKAGKRNIYKLIRSND
ncbi:MAG TPA: glycosyltransferase [Cytophagaceae bacterium]|jgi:glycosyltransferase involved in cell wall biosynthesis|nr:glycosyltransferase [Cytophagaceae bacterium]